MTGLVSWWPFHRTFGSALDLGSASINGTISGPTRGVAGRAGLQAFSFDGSNDLVSVSDSDPNYDFGTQDFSFFVWYKPKENPGVYKAIVEQFDGGGGRAWSFRQTTDRDLFLSLTGDGTTQNTIETTTQPIQTDSWHHVGFTRSGTQGSIYVDGSRIPLGGGGGSLVSDMYNSDRDIDFAYTKGPGRYLNCLLCDARLYGRQISPQEVQRLYEWGSLDLASPPDNDDGGVAYWTLDESSGDAIDQWGSNDGTVNGATQNVSGIRNTAYSFDGSNDNVQASTSTTTDSASVTASAWVNKDGQSDFGGIVGPDEGNGQHYWVLRVNGSNNEIDFVVGDGNSQVAELTFSSAGYAGEWLHLCGTSDGSTAKLYINSELETSASASVSSSPTGFRIGSYDAGGTERYFKGDIDDVRIYNRALEPWEVHEIYRYGTFGRDMRELTVEAR